MAAPRVFVDGVYALGDRVALAPDDARKLRVVLRLGAGDPVTVLDSSGRRFEADLAFEDARAFAVLRHAGAVPPAPALRIVLAQALSKGQKMDYVVEKATELGVTRVIPFTSERTASAARDGKVDRWRRVAKSAAAQCGRSDVPEIEAPIRFETLLERMAGADRALVPWELADPAPLRERLPALIARARNVLVAIGPEGGFSDVEAELARAKDAEIISLGTRILRTETAGLVVCSALLYASGDL